MGVKLKPLKEQVIVITGASSGIGLATARRAAQKGARLVLCSRNFHDLTQICDDLNSQKQTPIAIAVECDVADPEAVERVAERAESEFGRIDTWVNNAGVSIYGKLTEVPMVEKRRLFDVNFWGVVHGCRSAIRRMKSRGGAIINVGSIVSDRAFPMQGIYSASKHAVKGYTDSLRMEIEGSGLPISITLVKPGSIDTPFTEHAVNHMQHHPNMPGPVYAPEVVADAILNAAEHPRRDVYVGGSTKLLSFLETLVPRLADLFMERSMMESAQSSATKSQVPQEPALFDVPGKEGRERGDHVGRVRRRSVYTSVRIHPGAATLVATGLGLMAAAGIGYLQNRRSQQSIPMAGPAHEVYSH